MQYKGSSAALMALTENWWDPEERWADAISAGVDLAMIASVECEDNRPLAILGVTWGMPRPTRAELKEKADEAWRHQSDSDFEFPSWMQLYVAVNGSEVYGEADAEDLMYAARVLKRYVGILERAGRGY